MNTLSREDILQILEKQLQLLKMEKAADYEQYQQRMIQTTLQEREKNGVTWYPVSLEKDFISTGDRITLEIAKTKNFDQKHSFQVGAVVGIFAGSDEKKILNGVVSYLRESVMRIVLNQSYLPDWIKEEKLGLNLLFDDATYKEMDKAIRTVIGAKNDRLAELRDVFYGIRKASQDAGHSYQIPSLNEVQNQAFGVIQHAKDVAFVHGPPGTGKTTTLVKCIKETVQKERQVLVCASSNAAVDLLVERLTQEEVNVLRIGHPARLTPEVVENSLDVKMSKHPDFSRLKEMRKQSEEFRTLAGKYKRSFGRKERKERDLLYKESKALKRESRYLEHYISDNLVDRAEVVACTLTGAANSLIRDRFFKTIFIDESSQALEAACWIPLDRVQRVIMSGDHFQLPPTIKSFEAAKAGLEETLFSRGIQNQPAANVMLEEQYRMHPEIMQFSSDHFYMGKLTPAPVILSRNQKFEIPILFVDTAGSGMEEQVKKETLSTYNEGEAELLLHLLASDQPDGLSIGVIAPYKAQVEILNSLALRKKELGPYMDNIDINSVDAFQGQERDVVYISLTRSNPNGEIGFLKEYRRLNVAMTRARHRLVMVGDSATLGSDPFFEKLISYVQSKGSYQSVYELEYQLY